MFGLGEHLQEMKKKYIEVAVRNAERLGLEIDLEALKKARELTEIPPVAPIPEEEQKLMKLLDIIEPIETDPTSILELRGVPIDTKGRLYGAFLYGIWYGMPRIAERAYRIVLKAIRNEEKWWGGKKLRESNPLVTMKISMEATLRSKLTAQEAVEKFCRATSAWLSALREVADLDLSRLGEREYVLSNSRLFARLLTTSRHLNVAAGELVRHRDVPLEKYLVMLKEDVELYKSFFDLLDRVWSLRHSKPRIHIRYLKMADDAWHFYNRAFWVLERAISYRYKVFFVPLYDAAYGVTGLYDVEKVYATGTL